MKDQDYTFGTTIIYCDVKNCHSEREIEGDDGHCLPYTDINKELREMGWIIKYQDGEWKDFCCDKCANN